MSRFDRRQRALFRSELAGAAILWRMLRQELGVWRGAEILCKVASGQLSGHPFRGPARDERDRLSRRQLGPLLNLHRALVPQIGSERSLELLSALACEAGTVFLVQLLPAAMGELLADIPGVLNSFFNAEGAIDASAEEVRFTVHRCRFVELLDEVGAPELKPLFCAVDESFFAKELVPIRMARTRTLAAGSDCCDFVFTAA